MAPMEQGTGAFFDATARTVADRDLRRKLENAVGHHLEQMGKVRAQFPAYDAERDAARRIKHEALGKLDSLLLELKEQLEGRGCKVFFAASAAEARDYVVSLARQHGVKRIVKGKSMVSEEIELNAALEAAAMEVVETDLGEYIVQLRHERPSHIVAPAIHLAKEDVAELFHQKLGIPYTTEAEQLTAAARARLRATFLAAEMGITGVNFAVAETGTLVLVENEGNGRLSSTLPELFVALMGIEKVIPRLGDLSHFIEVLARTGTGQKITTYTNFISGPRRPGELDGPGEMHLVIVDNGRSAMLADPVLREALYCLRCGACLNVCPVYRRIGGHAYGSPYSGPIGSIVSPTFFGNDFGHLPFASTLCGACKEICPVRIDIPRILLHLRWRLSQAVRPVAWPPSAQRARRGARLLARFFRHPRLVRAAGVLGALVLRPLARNGFIKRLPPPFNAWTQARDLPALRMRPWFADTPRQDRD